MEASLWVDGLAVAVGLVVELVVLAIMAFTAGYLWADAGLVGFYGLLHIFAASMHGLVLSGNLGLLFVAWEVVGLCSFLLIGF